MCLTLWQSPLKVNNTTAGKTMPPRKPSRGLRAQIDREIADLDRERARLVAARAALDRDVAPRISQDDVAAYLTEHPGSTYTGIAEGLGSKPTNIAGHLKRGKQAGRFRSDRGRWNIVEG